MKKTLLFSMLVVLLGAALLLSCSSGGGGGASLGGLFLFSADDGANGIEPWRSDGTEGGTWMLKDVYPSFWPSLPVNITQSGTYVYFVADDGVHGYELWATDGSAAGTRMVKEINPAASPPPGTLPVPAAPVLSAWAANVQYLTDVDGTLYFAANDGTNGQELWKSDGTEAGTVMVKDITPTAGTSSNPQHLSNANGTLYFTANDGINGERIWKSDGTASGTVMVNVNAPAGFFVSSLFTEMSGMVYFVGYEDASGYQLWKTDGTDGGTGLVGNTTCFAPGALTNVNGTLYFSAWDPAPATLYGWTLCRSDGTPGGTVPIGSAVPTGGYYPQSITNVDGMVFFTGDDSTNGRELWVSDGTTAGTVMVKDINPVTGSYPANLTVVNGTLFFSANDGTHGYELWKSDGTEAGTVMVKDILDTQTLAKLKSNAPAPSILGNGSNPLMLQNVNGTLVFFANDGYHGYEPWRSNGTAGGTYLIKDINAGTNSSMPVVIIN